MTVLFLIVLGMLVAATIDAVLARRESRRLEGVVRHLRGDVAFSAGELAEKDEQIDRLTAGNESLRSESAAALAQAERTATRFREIEHRLGRAHAHLASIREVAKRGVLELEGPDLGRSNEPGCVALLDRPEAP
jgi:predicted RNase H-like nuclease (RuvC/YqgF family)